MMSPLRVRHVVAQSVWWRCQVEQEPIQSPWNGVIRVRSIQDFLTKYIIQSASTLQLVRIGYLRLTDYIVR